MEQPSLIPEDLASTQAESVPLAERMRPKSFQDFHCDPLVLKQIQSNQNISMIFWGPPGCGKTTLALLYAQTNHHHFKPISAISSGVGDLRKIIDEAKFLRKSNRKVLLFIDEIHHFNRSQQDILLKSVEDGTLLLIGATTENPSFSINNALLSRCRVIQLPAIDENALHAIILQAVQADPVLSAQPKQIKPDAMEALIHSSQGDARRLLNLLESVYQQSALVIDRSQVVEVYQQQAMNYDRKGDYHYDVISAFIKSIRGSDPDAALYYLAAMLHHGEDIRFIARRMIILAAEDVGNAFPQALSIATSCYTAVTMIGMPEARIILAQTATLLASSPKSNRAYLGIDQALADIKEHGLKPVPLHLRNAAAPLMKDLGYGAEYQYPHDFPHHFVLQSYLPEELSDTQYYLPSDQGAEIKFKQYLKERWGKNKKFF